MTTFFTAPTTAARDEFVTWLAGVLADGFDVETYADALIDDHDWTADLHVEVRSAHTKSGVPATYNFSERDMLSAEIEE